MEQEIIKELQDGCDKNIYDVFDIKEDADEYIKKEYIKIMNRWKEKYGMFDIPSGMISISINGEEHYINIGNKKYDSNTIFDIASMTKFYTEFVLFGVLDDYKLNLNMKIGDISNNYENIKDLTLMDLISFNNTYRTNGDTRNCKSKDEALKILRTAYIIKEKQGKYLYTDLPIMILTDILEEYTKLSYKELFEKYIIEKYNLNDTYLDIDDNDRYITINKGLVNDPKANIFGGYYGHAGVKASSKDFIKFFSQAFNSKYNYLFTNKSKTFNEDGNICKKKALMGNLNLYAANESSIPSQYLPECGFAIQGSVRCHAENMIFSINGSEYKIASSIFLDLYTMIDGIKKYEEETGEVLLKEYETGGRNLIVSDIRKLLDYKKEYGEIIDLIGKTRLVILNNYIKCNKIGKQL